MRYFSSQVHLNVSLGVEHQSTLDDDKKRLVLERFRGLLDVKDPQPVIQRSSEARLRPSSQHRFRLYQRDKELQKQRISNFKQNFVHSSFSTLGSTAAKRSQTQLAWRTQQNFIPKQVKQKD